MHLRIKFKSYSFALAKATVLLILVYACNESSINKNQDQAGNYVVHQFDPSLDTSFKAPEIKPLDQYPQPQKSRVIEAVTTRNANNKTSKHFFINPYTNTVIPEEAQGKGVFNIYTSDDGLALDQIHCSFKDSKGHLWFGTNGGGVSRFDGKKFTNFNNRHGLASNVIICIEEDQLGNLWFGTDGNGASKFDGKNFTNYTMKDGLSSDLINSIKADRKGNVWLASRGGVTKYNGQRFTNYTIRDGLSSNAVKDMLIDQKGNLWLATIGGGINKYDGARFTAFRKANGLTSDTIQSIHEAKDGKLYIGTKGAGLCVYDGQNFSAYTVMDGLASNQVMTVEGDSRGNIWVGTNGYGVSKFDGQTFINYTLSDGMENSKVPSITEDNSGNIWISTFGSGVVQYSGNGFSNFTRNQGLPNNVIYGITEDAAGNLWFGSFGGGITKYDRKSFTTYSTAQGLPSNNIYSAAKDSKGHLWFGTFEGGVIEFDGQVFTRYTTKNGLAGDIVFCTKEDSKGNLWFGTSTGGISKFDGKSFTNYAKEQGLPANSVFCLAEDKSGALWIGTYGGGISRFDGKRFLHLNTQHGLADNTVWAITVDAENNIWFGTQQGLSMLSHQVVTALAHLSNTDTTFTNPLFQNFTVQNGLPDNFVTQVVEAGPKTLYVGTNLGISELVLQSETKGQPEAWKVKGVYNSALGYPVKDVNAGQGAMFRDRKGVLWIATGSEKTGLVRFDPATSAQVGSKAPTLVLQQLAIDNEVPVWHDLDTIGLQPSDVQHKKAIVLEEMTAFGRQLTEEERILHRAKFKGVGFSGIESWYQVPKDLVLSYDHNSIGFTVNAIQTDKNYLVQYQYMLEGYDKDWSPWTNTNKASFGNMDEGAYTFKVRAKNEQGLISETLTYSFTVLPPWWRTWWMYLMYMGIMILIVTAIVFWNNRRVIHQKRNLEYKVKIATEQIRTEKENVETQKQIAEDALKQLKGTQAQLIQAEKMASLGELTAGIAHEIQNPLNFVNNFSEVGTELLEEMKEVMDKGDLPAAKEIASEVQQSLEKIQYHGKRAGDIVKGMLQHSRSSSGQKEPIAINALCDEYFRLAYHGLKAKDKSFNVVFDAQFDANVGVIEAVPQEIGRVLLNLINNALYAVNHRKKTGEVGYEPKVLIETKLMDQFVRITVTDNGAGIPDAIKSKILLPFFTTKPTGEGTGLGLSLSYDIVTVGHGGTFSFESVVGQGTSFVVQLPIQSASA